MATSSLGVATGTDANWETQTVLPSGLTVVQHQPTFTIGNGSTSGRVANVRAGVTGTLASLDVNMAASASNQPAVSSVLGTALNSTVAADVSAMGNGTIQISGGSFTAGALAF